MSELRQAESGLREIANRLVSMCDHYGHPDWSIGEFLDGIRDAADNVRVIAAALSAQGEWVMVPREPIWIVNDLGELGVKVNDRFFFLYKGDNIQYGDSPDSRKDGIALHDDGTPMNYRIVGKREFGETCKPDSYYSKGYNKTEKGRYTEPAIYTPGLSYGKPEDGKWMPLPAAPQDT